MKNFDEYTNEELFEIYKEKKIEAVSLMAFEIAALWLDKQRYIEKQIKKQK